MGLTLLGNVVIFRFFSWVKFSLDSLMTNVVITLWIANEALAEQSDSTGVTLIEDTQGAPREGNKDLTKCEVITSLFSMVRLLTSTTLS